MDNHHVHVSSSTASCGICELSGLTADPKKVLYGLATALYHPSRGSPYAFVMWSDVNEDDSPGMKFWDFVFNLFSIDAPKYPELALPPWISTPEDNPKTGNRVVVFVWNIPHNLLREWYLKEKIARVKRNG